MKSFIASDVRRRFGVLLETTNSEPFIITKNGRAVAIILSTSDNELIFEMDRFLEERCWCKRIAEAALDGYISVQESNRIVSENLNAED